MNKVVGDYPTVHTSWSILWDEKEQAQGQKRVQKLEQISVTEAVNYAN